MGFFPCHWCWRKWMIWFALSLNMETWASEMCLSHVFRSNPLLNQSPPVNFTYIDYAWEGHTAGNECIQVSKANSKSMLTAISLCQQTWSSLVQGTKCSVCSSGFDCLNLWSFPLSSHTVHSFDCWLLEAWSLWGFFSPVDCLFPFLSVWQSWGCPLYYSWGKVIEKNELRPECMLLYLALMLLPKNGPFPHGVLLCLGKILLLWRRDACFLKQ